MLEPSYPGGKHTLLSIWFKLLLTQLIKSAIQRFAHLDVPTKYQTLTGIPISIPTSRLINTTNDACTYIPMIRESRQLVTDEPVEVQDNKIITNHRRGIYRIHPNLTRKQ